MRNFENIATSYLCSPSTPRPAAARATALPFLGSAARVSAFLPSTDVIITRDVTAHTTGADMSRVRTWSPPV